MAPLFGPLQWVLQIAHTMHAAPKATVRIVVTEKLYIPQSFGLQLQRLTETKLAMVEKLRLDDLNKQDWKLVQEAISLLNIPQEVVRIFVQLFKRDRKIAKKWFVRGWSEEPGFLVWKKCIIATLYSNYLATTLIDPIFRPNEHALRCGHGLVQVSTWQEHKSMHATLQRFQLFFRLQYVHEQSIPVCPNACLLYNYVQAHCFPISMLPIFIDASILAKFI